jgi:hypothetical protein
MTHPFILIDVPQRSAAWHAARCGLVTASRAKDILAAIKSGGEAAARRDYRLQLMTEILTGQPAEDGFVNADMQRGTDLEPDARRAYEARTGRLVQEAGFLRHPTLRAGCSIDGHIDGYQAVIELKVPRSATHLRYLRAFDFPAEHKAQALHIQWITGCESVELVSYDPRFPAHLTLVTHVYRATREALDDHESAVRQFLTEVDVDVRALATEADLPTVLQESVR